MATIAIEKVKIPKRHRSIKPPKLAEIAKGMKERGYNPSFPITLEDDGVTLVDGRHRMVAAELCGIEEVPYVPKPEGVLPLAHSHRCNSDQTLGSEDDVFDIAEYCWGYAQDGWLREQIAEALELSPTQVTYHSNIRKKLHPNAWELARVTKNLNLVTRAQENLVTEEVTLVTWKETHFRALLRHLAWEKDKTPGVKTAQVRAISEILNQFAKDKKKVTAKWIGRLAIGYAWQIKLKCYALENLKTWVGHQPKRELFGRIRKGVFGKPNSDNEDEWWEQWKKEKQEKAWERFKKAVEALNGKIPRLIVGRAEDMKEIEDESVDLIITSPPYNLGKGNWPMGGDGRTPREDGIGYKDALPEDDYQAWQIECLKEIYRVAKDGASLFYNHKVRQKDGGMIHPMEWLKHPDNPWVLRQEIIWDRGSTHNHCPVLFWPHDERIYWMTKGTPNLPEGKLVSLAEEAKRSTIWRFHGPVARTWHPAPFPPELPRKCIDAIGRTDLVVLDPFAGRCTTLKVAMEEFGHDAIGVDISGEYLEEAKKENKWMNESGD